LYSSIKKNPETLYIVCFIIIHIDFSSMNMQGSLSLNVNYVYSKHKEKGTKCFLLYRLQDHLG